MAHHGQAESYYNDQNPGQQYQPPPGPPQGYQQQYQSPTGPPQGYQQQYQHPQQESFQNGAKYSQQPPTYGQNFDIGQDNKQSFQETFKVDKPKFNDLWAGLLVRFLHFITS